MFGHECSARLDGSDGLEGEKTLGPDLRHGYQSRFPTGTVTQVEDRAHGPVLGDGIFDDLVQVSRGLGARAIGRRAQSQLHASPFYVVAACSDDYNPE